LGFFKKGICSYRYFAAEGGKILLTLDHQFPNIPRTRRRADFRQVKTLRPIAAVQYKTI
jgi:hypothetical protein